MYNQQGKDDGDGIIALVRETADGMGHLLADHIKLARLELVADIKKHGRQAALIAGIVPIIFLGYALACVGLSVVLSRWLETAGAFFLVGGVHLIGGVIAVAVAAKRLSRAQPLHDTSVEVDRSVNALTTTTPIANGVSVTGRRI